MRDAMEVLLSPDFMEFYVILGLTACVYGFEVWQENFGPVGRAQRKLDKAYRKKLASTFEGPIAEAREGVVLLHGKVKPKTTLLEAPFSSTRCVGYDVDLVIHGPASQKPGTSYSVKKMEEFELEDETGRILIQASEYKGLLNETSNGSRDNVLPQEIDAILPVGTYPHEGDLISMAYREACLVPGEEIYVFGHARWIQGAYGVGQAFGESTRRLAVSAAVDFPLRIAHDKATIRGETGL